MSLAVAANEAGRVTVFDTCTGATVWSSTPTPGAAVVAVAFGRDQQDSLCVFAAVAPYAASTSAPGLAPVISSASTIGALPNVPNAAVIGGVGSALSGAPGLPDNPDTMSTYSTDVVP